MNGTPADKYCGRIIWAHSRTSIVVAASIFLVTIFSSSFVAAQAFKFYTQTIANRLATGMDASGVDLEFGTKLADATFPAAGSIVKAKDRNGGAFVNLARGANPGFKWTYNGTLGGFSVTADPPPPPFANGSNADVRWNYKFPAVPIRSVTWRDNNNAALGAGTTVNAVGDLSMDQFNMASLTLMNDMDVAVTFENIRIYLGENMANYTIDNFDSPTGPFILLPAQIVPPNSTLPPILLGVADPSKYQLMTADISASGFSEVFPVATASAVPEPAPIVIASTGCVVIGLGNRRRKHRRLSNIGLT